jgi:hypothetical protein
MRSYAFILAALTLTTACKISGGLPYREATDPNAAPDGQAGLATASVSAAGGAVRTAETAEVWKSACLNPPSTHDAKNPVKKLQRLFQLNRSQSTIVLRENYYSDDACKTLIGNTLATGTFYINTPDPKKEDEMVLAIDLATNYLQPTAALAPYLNSQNLCRRNQWPKTSCSPNSPAACDVTDCDQVTWPKRRSAENKITRDQNGNWAITFEDEADAQVFTR